MKGSRFDSVGGRKILLVEGKDDEHVLRHICGNRGLPHLDEVIEHGGIEPLLESFPVRLKESDVQALGVVVDADVDIESRWRSMHDRLVEAGFESVPDRPSTEGTILEPPGGTLLPRVGVWIMPDNSTPGILEDFLRFLAPVGLLLDHVESSVNSIPEGEIRFPPNRRTKAVIHTWLAWQEEPGNPLGTAITKKYLDPDVPQVDVLAGWLNRLFFRSA